MLKKTDNSFLIWDGESEINTEPISVIGSGFKHSSNMKTGDMIQTWILPNINPVLAVKTGEDSSVCGNCWRRPLLGNKCYVTVMQAPNQVFKTKDKLVELPDRSFSKGLRLGSWGDPNAVPSKIWQDLIPRFTFHTGYTSRWKHTENLKGIVQASCSSLSEKETAKNKGWKTFTALPVGHPIPDDPDMVKCPADQDGVTCENCRLCDGVTVHVWTYDHGVQWKQRKWE